MSVALAYCENLFYKILFDSAINYGGVLHTAAHQKSYITSDCVVVSVGQLRNHHLIREAIVQQKLHRADFGDKQLLAQQIIKKANDLGKEWFDDFELLGKHFMTIRTSMFFVSGPFINRVKPDEYYAIGSGRKFVYGAMDSGRVDPRMAIQTAIRRDPYCGGPVNQIWINKNTGEVKAYYGD